MRNVLLKFLSMLMLAVVCYATTIKDIHYLFLHHAPEQHHHCSNHLHETHAHNICFLCKITLPFATKAIAAQVETLLPITFCDSSAILLLPPSAKEILYFLLRGPPAI